MDNITYEELVKHAQSIAGFSKLVSSESKHKVAVNALCSVASIDKHTANEFINEYYSRMDIKLTAPKVLFNDLKINR